MRVGETRRLPLRGADVALMAMQALWRPGGASNNALLVVECDGPLAPDRVGRALDRLLDGCPWPAARLRRPFPWGALHWAAGPRETLARPPIRHRALASADASHRALEAELGAAIDPRCQPPLRVALLERGASHGALVLTWFHPLMDPRGAQNLLGYLAAVDRGEEPTVAVAPPPEARSYRERGRLARQSRAHIRTLMRVAPASPGSGLARAGPARFHLVRVDGAAPRDGSRLAGLETTGRLAAVARAMADLSRRRGLPDVPFLVPIAVDLRPKGDPGPMIGNVLAFHFAQFARAQADDPVALARTLWRQMADAVREGHVEASAAALEFVKYRRLRTLLRELPGTARGETFSFNFADLGGLPGAGVSLFGRRILNAYHVPAVMPRPGVGVFFNRCGEVDNMVTSWIEGAASAEEVKRIAEIVRDGLAGIAGGRREP